jgi:hypothetical protein
MSFKAIAQGRKIGGFSLRQSLTDQGVTTEEGMRQHMRFVADTIIASNGKLDITRYRVNPNNPNDVSSNMG